MAYALFLAQRMRKFLENTPGLTEKKMFGGVGFMLEGNMACGVHGQNLIVRVGTDKYQETLRQPFTHVFDLTGRPMTGWVTVSAEGYEADHDLQVWIEQGIQFARSLPAK